MTYQKIASDNNPHKYFHMMLNMAEDDLDPFQYRLLAHYIRWTGHNGIYEESLRQTSQKVKMSVNTVQKVLNQLIEMGYLKVERPDPVEARKGKMIEIMVIDRWQENTNRYATPVSNTTQVDKTPVSKMTQVNRQPVLNLTQQPPKAVSNLTRLEEQSLEELNTEEKDSFTPEGVGVAVLDISLQQPQKPTGGNAFEPFIENELFEEKITEKPIEPEPQPKSKPQPATKPPRPRDELFDVISELWGIKTGGWVANIKAMLTGTAKKGAYAQCNFDVPATPAEIRDFAKWWKSQDFVQDKNLKLPTQPDTIQRRFYEYRDSRPKFKVVVEPETPLPPVIHRQPGEPIAMTGDDVMAMIANGAKAWEF